MADFGKHMLFQGSCINVALGTLSETYLTDAVSAIKVVGYSSSGTAVRQACGALISRFDGRAFFGPRNESGSG